MGNNFRVYKECACSAAMVRICIQFGFDRGLIRVLRVVKTVDCRRLWVLQRESMVMVGLVVVMGLVKKEVTKA